MKELIDSLSSILVLAISEWR